MRAGRIARRAIPSPWRLSRGSVVPQDRNQVRWELARRDARQQHRGPGPLAEVEICGQVAEGAVPLTHVRSRVWPAIALTEPPPSEKVILDELQVRVEAEGLVVDVSRPRVRADDQ